MCRCSKVRIGGPATGQVCTAQLGGNKLNTPQANAFALPGGYIYVNRGLIESTDKLSELAGTLGARSRSRTSNRSEIPFGDRIPRGTRSPRLPNRPLEEARIDRARQLIADLQLDREGNLLIDTPNFQAFKTRVRALPQPLVRAPAPP